MEYDLMRILGAFFTLILGALALQKYLRIDYEKKISNLETLMNQNIKKLEKNHHEHDKQIHQSYVNQAELKTITKYIKESIEKIDRKIDELSSELHQKLAKN